MGTILPIGYFGFSNASYTDKMRLMKVWRITAWLPRFLVILLSCVTFLSAAAQEPEKQALRNPAQHSLPNVLIIGDSISLGYTPSVVKRLRGLANVYHNPGNAGNSGRCLQRLPRWLEQLDKSWDVIHFNCGLWDLCYRNPSSKVQGNRDKVDGTITHSPEEYRANLKKLVAALKKTEATLIWASTTPVPEGEAGRKVGDDLVYNRIAAQVMQDEQIPINDLHTLMKKHMKTHTIAAGNVHFTPAGSEILAQQVARKIAAALKP